MMDAYSMVLILDGNSEHITHACREKIRTFFAFDLIKCLKIIKLQRLPLTSAPISELPFNISTMAYSLLGMTGSSIYLSPVAYSIHSGVLYANICLHFFLFSIQS